MIFRCVVHYKVHAHAHLFLMAGAAQRSQLLHRTQSRLHLPVICYRIASITFSLRGIQKRHQMQVVYVACFQVRQLFLHTLQIAGKSIDIQHHTKHILTAVPCRLLFPLPVQLLF